VSPAGQQKVVSQAGKSAFYAYLHRKNGINGSASSWYGRILPRRRGHGRAYNIEGQSVGASIYLSIVIPAYNEAQRISHTLHQILAYLQQQPYSAEVIVVDDGSHDATARIVAPFCAQTPPVYLLHNEPNRGKGFSVRQGFLHARGAYLLFSDADLSTPIEEVEKLLAALHEPYAIAVASRALPQSRVEVHQAWYRESMGRLFNLLVRTLVLPGVRDTQCGFKCFTRQAALDICQYMTVERFGFDVEMLYLARRLGYQVCEVPVVWRNSPQTHVRILRDAARMLGDVCRMRCHALGGLYNRGTPPFPAYVPPAEIQATGLGYKAVAPLTEQPPPDAPG
jgi:dolichyl-phosphate beta-glucosyltransferase